MNTSEPYRHDEFDAEDVAAMVSMKMVCRGWNEVLCELLAEYIIIYNKESLTVIVERLEASKKASKASCGNGLGWGGLTRRIDLRMHRRDEDLPCVETTAKLIRLFRCTPNVEIFINSNGRNTQAPGRTHPKVMQEMVACFGDKLRRVDWSRAECPSWADLATLLQGTPNIETLSLITVYGQSIPLPENTSINLKYLKCLSLGMPTNALPYIPHSWDPLLSCLSIAPQQLPSLERFDVNPFPSEIFFVTHGYKIRTLRTTSADMMPFLPSALDLCLNLHTLIIPPNTDLCISESHPSIERIGMFPLVEDLVGVPERIYENYVMVPLEECLLLLEGMSLPKLKVVRVRNVGSLADVVDHSIILQMWWRRWNIRGVKFEDKLGRPFDKVVSGT